MQKAQAMVEFRRFLWMGVLCCMVGLVSVTSAHAFSAPDSFAPLVEKLTPAVVNIATSKKVKNPAGGLQFQFPGLEPGQQEQFREFFKQFGDKNGTSRGGNQPKEKEVHSLGSGFVIDASGYIVTNNHVIAEAEEIKVIFADDKTLKAKLVGRDPKTDIALLKVESSTPLPFVKFGDSDNARVGDWVIAIGNPFGLGGTVSAGIISARSRNINSGPFDDFIQTDAAINRGNSGGPMFNAKGAVIGVNTAIFSPTGGNVGIGFAVPAALVQPVIKQLKEYGRTHRGWLGVKIQPVTDEIAESVGLKGSSGALVLDVDEEGPAIKSGFKAGDIILEFDGKPIKEMHFLPRVVAETKIGKKVAVVVWRDGGKQTLSVTLGELDESDTVADASMNDGKKGSSVLKGEKFLGMELKKLDSKIKKRLSLGKDVTSGVVILSLHTSSEAVKRGLRAGDVIIGVNQSDISSVSELKAEFDTARRSNRKYVLMRVYRRGNTSFVTLPTTQKK